MKQPFVDTFSKGDRRFSTSFHVFSQESSQVGLDGTETTLAASVSLRLGSIHIPAIPQSHSDGHGRWEFNLELQLAPQEGSIDGQARLGKP